MLASIAIQLVVDCNWKIRSCLRIGRCPSVEAARALHHEEVKSERVVGQSKVHVVLHGALILALLCVIRPFFTSVRCLAASTPSALAKTGSTQIGEDPMEIRTTCLAKRISWGEWSLLTTSSALTQCWTPHIPRHLWKWGRKRSAPHSINTLKSRRVPSHSTSTSRGPWAVVKALKSWLIAFRLIDRGLIELTLLWFTTKIEGDALRNSS